MKDYILMVYWKRGGGKVRFQIENFASCPKKFQNIRKKSLLFLSYGHHSDAYIYVMTEKGEKNLATYVEIVALVSQL